MLNGSQPGKSNSPDAASQPVIKESGVTVVHLPNYKFGAASTVRELQFVPKKRVPVDEGMKTLQTGIYPAI